MIPAASSGVLAMAVKKVSVVYKSPLAYEVACMVRALADSLS